MKATFLQRLAAYLVDTLIISVIISFFGLQYDNQKNRYKRQSPASQQGCLIER